MKFIFTIYEIVMDRDTLGQGILHTSKSILLLRHSSNNKYACTASAQQRWLWSIYNLVRNRPCFWYKTRNCNLQNGCDANLPEGMFNTKQILPFPKITKRSNRCKSYITSVDVFGIFCWNIWRKWSRKKWRFVYGMLFWFWGMVPPETCGKKKWSVFGQKSPQIMEISFILYRLRETYLFDKYDKYVIYLLNCRFDLSMLWLQKKPCFFLFFCILCFNNEEFTFPFLNYFFHLLFLIKYNKVLSIDCVMR